MQVFLTRNSVAAGDDTDAPHEKTTVVPDGSSIDDIIATIAQSNYLASIHGGRATWVATSRIPVAVVAQEWDKPKMFHSFMRSIVLNDLDMLENVLRLHFIYYRQDDPELVFKILGKWTAAELHAATYSEKYRSRQG